MVYFSSASLVQSMSVEVRLVASLLDPTQLFGNTYSERYCSCNMYVHMLQFSTYAKDMGSTHKT